MRSIHALFATAFVALSLGSFACSSPPEAEASDTTQSDLVNKSSAVKLTQADDGTTVTVKAGRDVVLKLPQNASTGYAWMVTSSDLGDPQRDVTGGNVNRPGAAGTVKFTWSTAGQSGLHTIELSLQRPWAETTPAADHFSVTLDIQAAPSQGAECGGFLGLGCKNPNEYCEYASHCGSADGSGVCKTRPEFCAELVSPVCGCDGNTYGNACEANTHGVTVASDGACAN